MTRFGASSVQQQSRPASSVASLSDTGDRKLISSSEIPSFISREDIVTQILRWATIEAGTRGLTNFGSEMSVTPYYRQKDAQTDGDKKDECLLWGFDVDILEDGASVCKLGVRMDNEVVEDPQYIGIGDDGFPVREGKMTEVEGKFFQIWKLGDDNVTDELRGVIRRFCESLSKAVATYYAFGSCFVDDI